MHVADTSTRLHRMTYCNCALEALQGSRIMENVIPKIHFMKTEF